MPVDRPAAAAAQAQDRFTSLALRVADPVRRYLLRRSDPSTAEEVLNDTLLVCWRRLDDVPAGAEVAWAIGVARQCLANAERAARRRSGLFRRIAILDTAIRRTAITDPSPDAGTSSLEDEVSAALATLSDHDADVLRLWAGDDLTPAEIAQVLGIGVNAATVRLHRAKGRLRTALERRAGPGARHESGSADARASGGDAG